MQMILKIPGFMDNVLTHLLAGLGAGFFAVCIGSPVDVVGFFSCPVSFTFSHELYNLESSTSPLSPSYGFKFILVFDNLTITSVGDHPVILSLMICLFLQFWLIRL